MKQSCLINIQEHANGYSFTRQVVNSLIHLRKKKFLLIFTLVLGNICSCLKAQPVFLSDLQVDISKPSKEELFISDEKVDYLFFYLYPLTVTQTIYLADFEKDTLTLYLENTSMWNQILLPLFFHDMTVTAKKESQESVVSLPFDFNGDSITIILPASTCEINIRFQYQSDFCMRNDSEETIHFLQAQMYFQHSWYFIHPDMKLNKVSFRVPDNEAYFFVQSLKQKAENHYEVDVANVKENDISFYLLNKTFYEKVSFGEESVSVHLFLTRGVEMDSSLVVRNGENKMLYQILPMKRVTSELIDRSKQKIKKILHQAIQVFNYKDSIEINICEGYLALTDEKGKRYNWGCAMPCTNKSHFLLIDTSHWALTHEMLHPFNKYEPVREDSSYFFW
jgi:acetolactate synthase small subunit